MSMKTLGLCIARFQDDESIKTLEYVHKFAKEKGYRVLTFYPYMGWHDGVNHDDTENLYMINFSSIDALIIDLDKIDNMGFIRKLVKISNSHGVPTVVMNGMCDGAISIVSTVESTFEKVVRHVIVDHGRTRVNFIAGFKNKWNTESLIDIYRTALKDNNIEFDPKRVGYGEYYGEKAKQVIDEFLDYDTPDAIICANDEMAIIACQKLKEKGLRVPEDVVVTGIDGCLKSRIRRPLLTTCKKNPYEICKKALDVVKDKLDGKNVNYVYNVEAEAILSESCGCEKDVVIDCTDELDWLYEQKESSFVAQTQLYMLTEKLMQASQINDIANVLLEGLPQDAFFCVKDSFMQDIFQDSIPRVPSGNDKFYIIADSRKKPHTWESFILDDLFPEEDDIRESEYPIIITPIHYQRIQYGYIVLNSEKYRIQASVLERYIMNFNSTIGRYVGDRKLRFVNSELFHVNESIKQMRERDLLTGMYNSKGFLRELEYLKEKCFANNEKLVLVCIDLDGLGKLNDIYGHSEGDVAIQTLAKILQDSVGNEDVCTHLGSDEFVLAMRTKIEPEDLINTYFLALDGRVENYNAVSGKEYSLEINKTYLSVKPSADMDMKAALDEALSRKRMLKQNKRGMSIKEAGKITDDVDKEEYQLVQGIISDNKFKYAFQPIVNASNGEIVAYEALMRADTEQFVSPLTIIKYATMDDRLYEIEYSTFFNILDRVQGCLDNMQGRKVFVNSIPGSQLNGTDYAKLRRKYKNVFDHLVVEITEQTEMDDKAVATIRERSEKDGFEVAIDDYGTGYSNTTSLLRYLPNYIKIDRLLISDVHEDPKKQHFVKNIIEFAHENGFLALAEGVETLEELTAVIKMGADLIQGYYTAKPAFEMLDTIPEDIKNDIVGANLNIKETTRRKVYVADNEEEVFLVRLALENYTCLVVSQPEITIVGNVDYPAELQIRVKDCSKTTIHLKNVSLSGDEENPCIDIGVNSELVLDLENANYLSGLGIRVPENASLKITGDSESELHIDAEGETSYAIGNDWNSPVGQIEMSSDGLLDIKIKGTYSIGIGGGNYRNGLGTKLLRGKILIELAGANSIGIGSVLGRMPIVISECSISESIRAYTSVGIGTWNGEQDIDISNALIEINGSANTICAIGSVEGFNGSVRITSAHVMSHCNGAAIVLIGNQAMGIDVSISKARIDLHGEGNSVVGMGSYDKSGMLSLVDSMINMIIKAAIPIDFGAKPEDCRFIDIVKNVQIND